MSGQDPTSRRAFLSGFLNPLKAATQGVQAATAKTKTRQDEQQRLPSTTPSAVAPLPRSGELVAIVLGGQCTALENGCSLCLDTCPVPGAMRPSGGLPMVEPAVCTGCQVCHEVCPAPGKAIRMIRRDR